MSPASMRQLATWPELTTLELKVLDGSELRELSLLKNLAGVHLDFSEDRISLLPVELKLESLSLFSPAISDESVDRLLELRDVKAMSVVTSKISADGLQRLQQHQAVAVEVKDTP